MNELLRISFGRLNYDYAFLTDMCRNRYGPDYLFMGEAEICLALKRLRTAKARIAVMPDFDMDGISAGGILYAGLSLLGFRVSIHEPDPSGGYGIRQADVDAVLERFPDTKAILTCDVGAGEEFAVAYAKSMGLEVYVTDHHIEKPGHRVDADAVMDPCRYDETAEFTGVCGAWVAWHLIMTYARLAGTAAQQELCRKLVLFTGLGSCGDLMPVLHDTRSAIQASVKEFNALLDAENVDAYFGCPAMMLPEPYAAPFENLRSLHFFLVDCGKIKGGDVTDETYSFTYCPMFNSVRRMGEKMDGVYRMLYHRYSWNSIDRLTLFRWISDLNDSRKQLVQDLFKKLDGVPDQALAPYIYLIDAAPGILGLLAAKLMDKTGKPCLVLRPDPDKKGFSGSGRVPEWMDKGDMLVFDGVTFDGHDHAFGAFVRQDRLMEVWRRMDARYNAERERHEAETVNQTDPRPVICVGGHASLGDYDFSITKPDDCDTCMDYAMEIDKMRPFGPGFREPEFVLRFTGADVKGARVMGADRTHLKLDMGHGLSVVWFGGGWMINEIELAGDDAKYALSGTFGINEFNGSRFLQFMVSGRENI